jgi:hypothetical protein
LFDKSKINPYKPLTLDCKVWATAKHKMLVEAGARRVSYLRISPQLRAGRFIGEYRLPGDRWPENKFHPTHTQGNGWTHHFAVIFGDDNTVVDELHPDGVPLEEYMQLFEQREVLEFKSMKICALPRNR